jgi:hypothetical protein
LQHLLKGNRFVYINGSRAVQSSLEGEELRQSRFTGTPSPYDEKYLGIERNAIKPGVVKKVITVFTSKKL